MNSIQVVLITGATRGLGLHLAQIFLKKNPQIQLILTSRLQKEKLDQISQQWKKNYSQAKFSFVNLDISSKQSIQNCVTIIKKRNILIDVLVNNAAIGVDWGTQIPKPDYAYNVINTNLFGTINFTQSLLPYLSKNTRIINVSSKLGAIKFQPQQKHSLFMNALSQQQIFKLGKQFIESCQKGKLDGWFYSAYGNSKLLLNSWTRFVLKKKLKQEQVAVCMSPGHCKTDMGGQHAVHTPQSGAESMYLTIFIKDLNPDAFYHRGIQSDYFNCGPLTASMPQNISNSIK